MAVEIKGDTRIFSPQTVPRLCVAIGHQVNEFMRLKSLRSRSICRLEHIDANSSGKVVAKWDRFAPAPSADFINIRANGIFDPAVLYGLVSADDTL